MRSSVLEGGQSSAVANPKLEVGRTVVEPAVVEPAVHDRPANKLRRPRVEVGVLVYNLHVRRPGNAPQPVHSIRHGAPARVVVSSRPLLAAGSPVEVAMEDSLDHWLGTATGV
jgi:hypothetical protein